MKHNRFRHLLLAAMALTATTAAAQTVEQADTMALPTDTYWLEPVIKGDEGKLLNRYIFADNWVVGAHAGLSFNWGSNQREAAFLSGLRPSLALSIGKWLSPYVVLRGMLAYANNRGVTSQPYKTFHWQSAMLNADGMFSLTNILCGYRESRPFNLFVFLGVGGEQTFGFSKRGWNAAEQRFSRGTCSLLNVHAGVEALFRLGESWDLTFDVENNWIDDSFDGVITSNRWDGHINCFVGLVHRLRNHDGTHQFTFITRDMSKYEEANREINRLRQAAELAKLNMPVVTVETEQVNVLVSFQENSSLIDAMQEVNVYTAAQHMQQTGNKQRLYITRLGQGATNEQLFRERAETIRRSLVSDYHIPADRITIEMDRQKVETLSNPENCIIVSINESSK